MAFSPDGKTLAAASDAGHIQSLDPATHRWDRVIDKLGELDAMTFSHDGSSFAYASGGRVYVRELPKGRRREMRSALGDAHIRAFALSRDGATVAAADGANRVRVWNTATGEEELANHVAALPRCAVRPARARVQPGKPATPLQPAKAEPFGCGPSRRVECA